MNLQPKHLGRIIFHLQKFRARGVLVFHWLPKMPAFSRVWKGPHYGWAPWEQCTYKCRPHFKPDSGLTNEFWIGTKNFDSYFIEFNFDIQSCFYLPHILKFKQIIKFALNLKAIVVFALYKDLNILDGF